MQTEPGSWGCDLCSPRGPCTQKGSTCDSMLCCCSLGILNNFSGGRGSRGRPTFSFFAGPGKLYHGVYVRSQVCLRDLFSEKRGNADRGPNYSLPPNLGLCPPKVRTSLGDLGKLRALSLSTTKPFPGALSVSVLIVTHRKNCRTSCNPSPPPPFRAHPALEDTRT